MPRKGGKKNAGFEALANILEWDEKKSALLDSHFYSVSFLMICPIVDFLDFINSRSSAPLLKGSLDGVCRRLVKHVRLEIVTASFFLYSSLSGLSTRSSSSMSLRRSIA